MNDNINNRVSAGPVMTESGLALTDGELEIRADLTRMIPRLRQSNLERELLVKAAKIKKTAHAGDEDTAEHILRAVDATAGFGEDSLLLAAAGFHVTLYEKDPVIAELLEDSLARAANVEELREPVSRMRLIRGDSIEGMRGMDYYPDVILLDPMFPERQKSAAVKKKFQLIHQIEKPCDNEDELFEAAVCACPKKLIVKRPSKGSFLAGRAPGYSLKGKAVRYDIYVNPGIKSQK